MNPVMIRSALFLLVLCFSPFYLMTAYAADTSQTMMVISVRTSPSATYEHKIILGNKATLRLLKSTKQEKSEYQASLTDIYVKIVQAGKEKHFRMEESGSLWNEIEYNRLLFTRKGTEQILKYADELRAKHYGMIMPWSEVQQRLPRRSVFSIIDLEKGLTFRVQRRAGSKHADVQPLTKQDTQTMKEIYNNQWSWDRKAIIVVTDRNRIAASMNGMPHGGDGIPDNGFSGHFCVHFLGSSTHRSKNPDLFHQLMVHTAAGKRDPFLGNASPDMLSDIFIGALTQRDYELFKHVSKGLPPDTANPFLKELENKTNFRLNKYKVKNANKYRELSLSAEIKRTVTVKRKSQTEKTITFRFMVIRESVYSPWKIRDVKTDSC
ncbi:hypothetical protein [Paenibacillus sp. OSY-SE]|uniref:hypothetical protein n=1 Tax=Paenibacillus sp. OSY-SE TaxID=1196323 RepID=UPI0002D7436B|nr:hypothetical protein [Paenibacillus sp. OSY-SE]